MADPQHGLRPDEIHELGRAAISAKAAAYCPYSKFRVGAALLAIPPDASTDAPYAIITGANVENAAYPVGICAERCAMAAAVAGEIRRFKAIAVATDTAKPAAPCGMCRQFIREFCDDSVPIFMFGASSAGQQSETEAVRTYTVRTLGQLLPDSFGPDDLHSNASGT